MDKKTLLVWEQSLRIKQRTCFNSAIFFFIFHWICFCLLFHAVNNINLKTFSEKLQEVLKVKQKKNDELDL